VLEVTNEMRRGCGRRERRKREGGDGKGRKKDAKRGQGTANRVGRKEKLAFFSFEGRQKKRKSRGKEIRRERYEGKKRGSGRRGGVRKKKKKGDNPDANEDEQLGRRGAS